MHSFDSLTLECFLVFPPQMTSGSIDYIPFQQALVLQGQEEDEQLKKELENLQKLVGDRFNSLIHRFEALEVGM